MELRECRAQRHGAKSLVWKIWSLKWSALPKGTPEVLYIYLLVQRALPVEFRQPGHGRLRLIQSLSVQVNCILLKTKNPEVLAIFMRPSCKLHDTVVVIYSSRWGESISYYTYSTRKTRAGCAGSLSLGLSMVFWLTYTVYLENRELRFS